MLLEPIKLTLYDPKTQEPLKEYQQRVITFEMLLAAIQLEEVLGNLPEKQRRWWWQKPITKKAQKISALFELVVVFFENQVTVKELHLGTSPSQALAVIRSIVGRAGEIFAASPYRAIFAAPEALVNDDGNNWLLDLACMLIENFHFSPTDLAQADIDLLLPFVVYYPHWKSRSGWQIQESQVFIDQVPWL